MVSPFHKLEFLLGASGNRRYDQRGGGSGGQEVSRRGGGGGEKGGEGKIVRVPFGFGEESQNSRMGSGQRGHAANGSRRYVDNLVVGPL